MKKLLIILAVLVLSGFQVSAADFTHTKSSRRPLQDVLNTLEDGDTLFIKQGIYVQKSGLGLGNVNNVSIIGDGEVWIICTDIYADVLRVTNCGSVTLENLKMRHQEPPEEYECNGSVLSAENVSRLVIERCELNGCGAIGVWAYECEGVKVTNCFIHDNTLAGIYLYKAGSALITHNTIVDNDKSFEVHNVDELRLYDNIIAYNSPDYPEE